MFFQSHGNILGRPQMVAEDTIVRQNRWEPINNPGSGFFTNVFSNMKVKRHHQGCVCREHSDAELTRRNALLGQGTKLQTLSPLDASGYWDYWHQRDNNGDYLPKWREQLSGVLHHLKLSLSPTQVLHSSESMCTTSHASQQNPYLGNHNFSFWGVGMLDCGGGHWNTSICHCRWSILHG